MQRREVVVMVGGGWLSWVDVMLASVLSADTTMTVER